MRPIKALIAFATISVLFFSIPAYKLSSNSNSALEQPESEASSDDSDERQEEEQEEGEEEVTGDENEGTVAKEKRLLDEEVPVEKMLTFKGMENILLDAQTLLSGMIDNLFSDPKVLECLAPHICNLIGSEYYYDPWKGSCKKISILARMIRRSKPTFPELAAACEISDTMFLDYVNEKGITPSS